MLLLQYIHDHRASASFIATIVLSAAVRALPEPPVMGSLLYRWLYNFAHGLLSNYDKLRGAGK